jgi:hypothetical protein
VIWPYVAVAFAFSCFGGALASLIHGHGPRPALILYATSFAMAGTGALYSIAVKQP